MKRRLATPLPALLLFLFLSGCSTPPDPPAGADRSSSPAPSSTTPFTATDSGWIQLMTPMNEQAGQLLALASARESPPPLASWAAALAKEHRAELAQLRQLLDRMGLPDTNVHEGHDMPGMVTDADLDRARRLTGADFDGFVRQEIRAHLEQSGRVSRSESQAGGGQEAKRLAARIADIRAEQLKTLSSLNE
ncbi:DUF305 domain-containing protein [Streptomyces scopuliridis]|uniref:DUF305 domain-containing protein n=1 Tax=Streptomyces scopuliridis TaxID=452529 RepID=A0ACD4ZWY2_9ACTN|nr:DUF305 domain-containing protein [Streptomyces scopuliridis]WSC02293.1 DUF305 domain-containing protein [Streptomyces scopuliridis]WSC04170.1 DUF305 domain-containing protein [Streptomyces scopuliridis]